MTKENTSINETVPPTESTSTKTTEPNSHESEHTQGNQTEFIVEDIPGLWERLQRFTIASLQWILQWKNTFQQKISVKVQYSPIRFTSGLTPVQLSLSGWGFCIYNGRLKHFHNSSMLLKIPIMKQTPIIIVGWGTLFKYSLFTHSSLDTVPNFSVQSYAQYAKPQLPPINIPSPALKITLPTHTIRIPTVPVFRADTDMLVHIRTELSDSEDL